jgi:hypothetical protein
MDTREQARIYLTKQLKSKLKPSVFEKNIEGLIDEYLEVQQFVINNGADVNELPRKNDIKWWFQDPIDRKEVENSRNSGDDICEIRIDDIYLNDKLLAKPIYKKYYNWKWEQDVEVPLPIKELISLSRSLNSVKDINKQKIIEVRLINIALLGVIRLYKMERKPYLKSSEIEKIIRHFKMVLDVIYKIENGFYGNNKINGSVYLFDAFGIKSNENIEAKKQSKPRRKKKADEKNDADRPS